MSTKIINLPYVQLIIKRISDYTLNHQSGLDDVPHLCIKVKHNNGFAWFGINLINFTQRPWTRFEIDEVNSRLLDSLDKMCDIVEIVTDMNRLLESIQDVTSGRKRPTFYGGLGNDMIQMHTVNNVQLDTYRDEFNKETLSYGGFMAEIVIGNQNYPAFLYHRGVILYHYIDEAAAKALIVDSLTNNFGELFAPSYEIDPDDVRIIRQTVRTRNKHRIDAHQDH